MEGPKRGKREPSLVCSVFWSRPPKYTTNELERNPQLEALKRL